MAALTTINCSLSLPPPTSRSRTDAKQSFIPRSENIEVSLGRRCATAVACVVIGTAVVGFGGGEMAVAAKWSERRACPAWNGNSLENTVPENLPRPLGRRATEVATDAERMVAPKTVSAPLLRYHSSCFSM